MRRVSPGVILVGLLLPCVCPAAVKRVPIRTDKPPFLSPAIARLLPANAQDVQIVVKDERPTRAILGVKRGRGGNVDFFAAEDPAAPARLAEWAANAAVGLLGFQAGPGGWTLEIEIREFVIEVYSFSGWSLGNYLAWGRVNTRLSAADGASLASESFPLAYYYSLNGPATAKLIGDSTAFLYERMAWEVTARTLAAHAPFQPDAGALRKRLGLQGEKNDFAKANVVFWVGLVAKDDPSVTERLFEIFRKEEAQRVYEEAAIALARMKAPGAAEELEAVLTGKKKLEEWENDDAEQVWYLVHALGILGVPDLEPKIPGTDNLSAEIRDVARLDASGELPAMSPGEKIAYDRAVAEVGR